MTAHGAGRGARHYLRAIIGADIQTPPAARLMVAATLLALLLTPQPPVDPRASIDAFNRALADATRRMDDSATVALR